MTISLAEKKILVTGATGAIGRAVAEAAHQAGAWVAGSYFSDETLAQELRRQGIRMFKSDLTDRAQARSLVEQVLKEAGHLDGLVYAAGNTRDKTLQRLTDDDWDQVIALHLSGLFTCIQAVLPGMRERRAGKLVAFGSMAGLTGRVGQANYSAAKAGTIGLMKTVAREAGRWGITANVICPGFIESKMTRGAPPEAWERAKNESLLGKVSSVATVSFFTTWLLSDSCSGVTGQLFQLDSRVS